MAPQELNFITGNKNKLAEVQAILGDVITLQTQPLDLLEVQGTVEEVTIDKAKRAAEIVRLFIYVFRFHYHMLTMTIGQWPRTS